MISTQMMTWDAKTRVLSAEISNIGDWRLRYILLSHRTGKQVEVSLSSEKYDDEGDLMWRDYKPSGESIGLNMTVRIFND
jgi:hypothetical protein